MLINITFTSVVWLMWGPDMMPALVRVLSHHLLWPTVNQGCKLCVVKWKPSVTSKAVIYGLPCPLRRSCVVSANIVIGQSDPRSLVHCRSHTSCTFTIKARGLKVSIWLKHASFCTMEETGVPEKHVNITVKCLKCLQIDASNTCVCVSSLRMTLRLWIPEVGHLCTWLCRWGTWSLWESFWDTMLKWQRKTPRIGQVSEKTGTDCLLLPCRHALLCGLFDHLVPSSQQQYQSSAINGVSWKNASPFLWLH